VAGVALAVLLVAAACGGDIGTNVDAGPTDCSGGGHPPLSACFEGAWFAVCGGTGMAVIGCSTTECKWFSDGCVAAGFTASDCPADNACCHNDWPFAGARDQPGLFHRVLAFGRFPWDRARAMSVGVTVDGGHSVTATQWTCGGTPPIGGNSPCTGFPGMGAATKRDTLEISAPHTGVGGWYPWIEVDFDQGGGPVARVCLARWSDQVGTTCADQQPPCAESGSVTLSDDDATGGLDVTVDVTFAGGFTLQGTVKVP
jgi:hypothetical protein